MRRNIVSQAILILVLHVTTGAAFAQFAWIDANGVRQYSDQPPPASTPKAKILKSPVHTTETAPSGAAGTKDGEKTGAAKAPLTTAEKNADFVKRQSEQAEKEKKAAEEAKNAAIKAKNCENTQSYARSLQSGERIASLDKNGERSFMSDEQRAKEISDTRRALDGCK
jgi:hypothetical protein